VTRRRIREKKRSNVKLVVGLGNPGREYEQTPHNVGFRVVESIVVSQAVRLKRRFRFAARTVTIDWDGQEVMLVEPLTFMNRSGDVVAPLMRYGGMTIGDVLVVSDDVNLEVGRLRIRPQGRSGGHKGLESIIQSVGGDGFPRIRLGVGSAEPGVGLVEHVLGRFLPDQEPVVRQMVERAAEAVRVICLQGVESAMNRFNGPVTDGTGAVKGPSGVS